MSTVLRVKTVFDVDFRFANQVVLGAQIPVPNRDCEGMDFGKASTEFETPSNRNF